METLKASPGLQAMYQVHRNVRADSENNTSAEFIAYAEEKCAANFIRLSVEPTGNKYSVSIPASGHQKTFVTRTK
jgi:hypothetical protein